MSLGRDHPVAEFLRVFAVHVYPGDSVVLRYAVLKVKLPVEVDLDKCPAVGFFGLVKLVATVAAGSLAIVELIESVSKDLRGAQALGIKRLHLSGDDVQFCVSFRAVAHALVLVDAASAPLLCLFYKLGKPYLESSRNSSRHIERGLTDSALDHADIGRMKPCPFGQRLLREAGSHTPSANGCSEEL